MQQVPLNKVPRQSMTVNIDGAYWKLTLYLSLEGVCADIDRDGTRLISGVRCFVGQPLLPYEHLYAPRFGNFIFDSDVDWELFDGKCNLYYLNAIEFAAIKQRQIDGFAAVAVKNSIQSAKDFQKANDDFNSEYVTVPVVQIITQPEGIKIWEYSDIQLNVVAINAIMYQWQVSELETGKAWKSISGAGSATLNIDQSTMADQGYYRCVLSDGVNTLTTVPVFVEIMHVPMPVFTLDPLGQLVVTGNSMTLTAEADFTDVITWQKSASASGPWVDIVGVTGSPFTINATSLSDNGYYRAVARSRYPTPIYSSVALIEVLNLPSVITQPVGGTFPEAVNNLELRVVAADTVSYQWEQSQDGINWAIPDMAHQDIPTTRSWLPMSPPSQIRIGMYRCKLTNRAGTAYTNVVSVNMIYLPVVTKEPVSSQPMIVGENYSMSFDGTPEGAAFRWQFSSDGQDANWQFIPEGDSRFSGVSTKNLSIINAQTNYPKYYRGSIKKSDHPITIYSANATISVYENVTIQQQPVSVRMPASSDSRTLSIVAQNVDNFQWQYSPNGQAPWSNLIDDGTISGAKTANMTVTLGSTEIQVQSQFFRCVVTNPAVTIESDVVSITYVKDPVFTQQPSDIAATPTASPYSVSCTTENATSFHWDFRESYNGGEFGAWNRLTDNIPGVSGATTRNPTITPDPDGQFIGQIVTNLVCIAHGEFRSKMSTVISVTVYGRPKITAQPQSKVGNQNSTHTFSVTATSATSYQWQFLAGNLAGNWTNFTEGSISSGTKTATLTRKLSGSGVANGQILRVRCIASNPLGSQYQVTSETCTESTYYTPVITLQPITIHAAEEGGTVRFNVAYDNALNTAIKWQVGPNSGELYDITPNPDLFYGEDTVQLTCYNINRSNWRFFRAVISTPFESVYSAIVSYTAFPAVKLITAPVSASFLDGSTISLSCEYENASSYQWRIKQSGAWVNLFDDDKISGAATNSLSISQASSPYDGKEFACFVSNNVSSETSPSAVMTMVSGVAPVISFQSQGGSFGNGTTFNLVVMAKPVTSAVWQYTTTPNDSSSWQATNPSHTTIYPPNPSGDVIIAYDDSPFTSDKVGYYRCIIDGIGGLTTTSTVKHCTIR